MRTVTATLMLVLLLWSVGLAGGCDQRTDPEKKRSIGTVDLVVDFGSTQQTLTKAIPCSADSTVDGVLRRAEQNGDLKLSISGVGETAFVNSINGVTGGSIEGHYWFFYVNGKLANQGVGVTEVHPSDEVRWVFQTTPDEFKE